MVVKEDLALYHAKVVDQEPPEEGTAEYFAHMQGFILLVDLLA
jgi:hypothetical protein